MIQSYLYRIYLKKYIQISIFIWSCIANAPLGLLVHFGNRRQGKVFFSGDILQIMSLTIKRYQNSFSPMKAAMMLQYSQAVGFPYAFTFASHFLQIDEVFDLLQVQSRD